MPISNLSQSQSQISHMRQGIAPYFNTCNAFIECSHAHVSISISHSGHRASLHRGRRLHWVLLRASLISTPFSISISISLSDFNPNLCLSLDLNLKSLTHGRASSVSISVSSSISLSNLSFLAWHCASIHYVYRVHRAAPRPRAERLAARLHWCGDLNLTLNIYFTLNTNLNVNLSPKLC